MAGPVFSNSRSMKVAVLRIGRFRLIVWLYRQHRISAHPNTAAHGQYMVQDWRCTFRPDLRAGHPERTSCATRVLFQRGEGNTPPQCAEAQMPVGRKEYRTGSGDFAGKPQRPEIGRYRIRTVASFAMMNEDSLAKDARSRVHKAFALSASFGSSV